MKEQWKEIEDFPRYEVSDTGKVRNRETGRVLKQYELNQGKSRRNSTVLRIVLSKCGALCGKTVHRLVAAAFVPNPDGLPQVEHINGDLFDNRAKNLRWNSHAGIMANKHIRKRINDNNPRTKKEKER